jgi:hypothetical protein
MYLLHRHYLAINSGKEESSQATTVRILLARIKKRQSKLVDLTADTLCQSPIRKIKAIINQCRNNRFGPFVTMG